MLLRHFVSSSTSVLTGKKTHGTYPIRFLRSGLNPQQCVAVRSVREFKIMYYQKIDSDKEVV